MYIPERLDEVKELISQGYGQNKIAEMTGINSATVSMWSRKYNLGNNNNYTREDFWEKVQCLTCDTIFDKRKVEIKKGPNHFCTRSCAAKHNNSLRNRGDFVLKSVSKKTISNLVDDYPQIGSLKKLSKKYSLSERIIKEILTSHNIEINKRAGNWYERPSNHIYARNQGVFNDPEKSAYWIGFLLTDGFVSSSNNSWGSYLSVLDIGHLEKLKEFVQYEGKIHKTKDGCAVLSINDKEHIKALSKLNVVPRKSFIARPPQELLYNINFWRGCIDGDGTISGQTTSRRQISFFSASENFILDYQKFLFKIFQIQFPIHNPAIKGNRAPQYLIQLHGPYARYLAYLLYYNASQEERLDRKYERALNLITKEYVSNKAKAAWEKFIREYSLNL